MCGDFNLIQNFNLDTQNYVNINNSRSREKLLNIKEDYNLVDPFRELYPDVTWRKRNPFKQSRLDFFLVSDSFFHSVCDVKIENGYRSDHSPVIFSFKINEFMKGKGLWKFNNSLLHDTEYVRSVKKHINDVKEQYSAHVYNKEVLRDIDNLDIQLIIDDELFLEILLTEIRG